MASFVKTYDKKYEALVTHNTDIINERNALNEKLKILNDLLQESQVHIRSFVYFQKYTISYFF